ncbi:uncharacterized protein LOC127575936 isoform X2 [Pristis pectinata]|nr:uncharacterized protein LOC127575936 isoform X2 [Pristis pectinata]XP_051882157.1 uncharacterized protein LOC127575936 isoform X2 [Pristis pectinata]XP_051882158.1 uncharacterized protein LOC127575936 isoform X2 [Pristis pectinata]
MEAVLEQDQCSRHKLLQLESQAMFQQLQVQLKPATVPCVKRKMYIYHDICKHVIDNEHPEIPGQDSETKTGNVAVDECEKITSMENVSYSKLQKSIAEEEAVKNDVLHGRARLHRNDDKMNTAKLRESTEETSLLVGCNKENTRHTSQSSDVLATEQPGSDCTHVDTGRYKANNGISSNLKTDLLSSIIQPKNMLRDQPIINSHDVPIRSNSICYLSQNRCEKRRTSLFDLLIESQILPDISNRQQNCSSNNICEPSQRNEGDSASNSEPVPFGSTTGPRSLNIGNKKVLQRNWSDSFLNVSQKTDSAILLQDSKSEASLAASSPDPVCIPHSLLSTFTNSRGSSNAVNHNNINSESKNISDSLHINELKPTPSLSLLDPGCQPRAASFITINSRRRQQYPESNDTNVFTPIKCNDDDLQHCRDGKERATLFANLKAETPSVITLTLSKTRMELATSRDADASLPDNENNDRKQNFKIKGRSTSLLPIQLIGSQLSTGDKNKDVVPACTSSSIDTALHVGDDDYLQKAKPEIGQELPADPKIAPQHLRNVVSNNNGAVQSNPSKSDDVNLECVNSTLQYESKTSDATEMSIMQSPNYENQVVFNQKSSSNNTSLTLDANSMQNNKPLYMIISPKVLSHKYQLLDDSVRSTGVTAERTVHNYKSEPNHVLSLPDTTKASPLNIKNGMKNTLQNMPPHTISGNLSEIPGVDNMQNYKSEEASTPSSSVTTQYLSTAFIHTNEGKLSKNYPDGGNSNAAQRNRCETFPETMKDQQSTVTKTQLRQGASLGGGNEYLPKDKSETSSNLISENSQVGQCILSANMDGSQKKSQTNFPLGGNIPMATISVENYHPENNIPFSSQDALTVDQSSTKGHNNIDKLLFHSPVRLSTNKNLEDYHSENYPAVLLPDTPFGLRASSSIKHGTRSTLQNWELNTDDNTKIRGISKEYKQTDHSKTDVAFSLPNVVSEQLTLNNIGITGDRKSLDYLQTLKSEISTPIMSSGVTYQVSPIYMMYNKDKQLNYLANTVDVRRVIEDHTQCNKSETTCVSSSLDLVTSQPPLVKTTESNRCESLNYSLDDYVDVVNTGLNKTLEKATLKICSIDPSMDPPDCPADTVQHLNDRSLSVNLDLCLDQLESPIATTNIKKNALPDYSDEGPCDQSKSENLAGTNTPASSSTGMNTQWYTSNNYPSKHPVHPSDSIGIHVGVDEYLQNNKSESHAVSLSPEVLTDIKATATKIEINKDTLQHDTSNETLHDKKSYDIFAVKRLHETNSVLSSPSVTRKRSPIAVENTHKGSSQPLTLLGGDITMDRGYEVYLEKDNSELSTSGSSTDLQPSLNIMQNITKSRTHFPLIDNISVGSDNEKNVEYCQSENHSAVSPTASTALRSPTNLTAGGIKNAQNLSPNNTFYRRTYISNAQDESKTLDMLIAEQPSTNANGMPKFSTIPTNKYVTKCESLNCSADSSVTTEDKDNEILQKTTKPTHPHLVTELNCSTNIPQDKILLLTQFPLNYNTTLGAESIKTIEKCQPEERCPVSSQDGVTGQKSLTNLHNDRDKPLTHLLKSGEMEINEYFQKDKPKITNVISPVICHHHAASVTDLTKDTLQHCTTKVTDIYHRKRPSNRFKLNLLHRAKSVPSLLEMTGQCQTDNISFCSNQEKSKTLSPLRENVNLLSSDKNVEKYQSEKYQAVSSIDELNKQCILTNTTHDSKDTIQKYLPNIDGIIVNRGFNNNYDLQDRCETKYIPLPLNPVSSQLPHIDIARNNEKKPPSQVLNNAVDAAYTKSPDNLENKRAVLSRDKVTQQISPISTAHSNKNRLLSHSSVIAGTVLSKIDKFNTMYELPMLDPVISQQPSSSSFMTLSDLLNKNAVGAEIADNKCVQKDAAETNRIAVDSQTGLPTVPTDTDMNKNIGQNYLANIFDTGYDRMPNEKSNRKLLHKTNSAPPSSPKRLTQCNTTNLTCRNQDKLSNHSMSDEIVMGRRNNDCTQRNKSEAITPFSLPACQQLLPSDIKRKQVKSLTHSPVRSDFEMNLAENARSQHNRGASLQSPIELRSSTDNNTEFQNSSPKNDMFLRRIGIYSENDISLSVPDPLLDEESSIDVTCSKNSKYLSKSMKIRDITLDQRWNDNCGQTDNNLINCSSSPSDSAPVLSPRNTYNHRNYSTDSGSISPQDNDIAKEDKKIFRCRQKTFPGRKLENRIPGRCMTNRHTLNSLQHCSPENQIGSEFMEINNLDIRLNANNVFSQYTGSSFSIDKENNSLVNNNYQAGTARFSKNYSKFTGSQMPNFQNAQSRYGHIFKAKCLKDIHSHYNQSSQQDQENLFSTNIRQNSKLTAQKRHVKPCHLFSSYTKRNRLYGSFPDLSFNGNEFDCNNWSSYHGSLDFDELVNGNEDTKDVSKEEAEMKDKYLEKMKQRRLWKPSEFQKKASSPSIEDVFDPLPNEVNQDPGVNDDTVKNNEYFPVDIKMFWPKENPTDIIRLLSSTSTGSKISEDSLSPQSHRIPAETLKQNKSCYSDTDSDTTTDDEYFLDCTTTAKESAL